MIDPDPERLMTMKAETVAIGGVALMYLGFVVFLLGGLWSSQFTVKVGFSLFIVGFPLMMFFPIAAEDEEQIQECPK